MLIVVVMGLSIFSQFLARWAGSTSALRILVPGLTFGIVVRLEIGVWRSLVAHFVRDEGVGGSNPLTPTK